MKLPIAQYANPILREKGEPIETITDDIRNLVKGMTEALGGTNGIGLAAQQVHQALSLFLTRIPIEGPDEDWIPGEFKVYINPQLSSPSEEKVLMQEGCLSFPGLYFDVERPSRIHVQAMDLNGNLFEEDLNGLAARVVMHENDHTNGVLYIDRIKGQVRREIEPKIREIKKKYHSPH